MSTGRQLRACPPAVTARLESFPCLLSNQTRGILQEKFCGGNADSWEPEARGAPMGRAICLPVSLPAG